jgi:hypothetical protein
MNKSIRPIEELVPSLANKVKKEVERAENQKKWEAEKEAQNVRNDEARANSIQQAIGILNSKKKGIKTSKEVSDINKMIKEIVETDSNVERSQSQEQRKRGEILSLEEFERKQTEEETLSLRELIAREKEGHHQKRETEN